MGDSLYETNLIIKIASNLDTKCNCMTNKQSVCKHHATANILHRNKIKTSKSLETNARKNVSNSCNSQYSYTIYITTALSVHSHLVPTVQSWHSMKPPKSPFSKIRLKNFSMSCTRTRGSFLLTAMSEVKLDLWPREERTTSLFPFLLVAATYLQERWWNWRESNRTGRYSNPRSSHHCVPEGRR